MGEIRLFVFFGLLFMVRKMLDFGFKILDVG